MSYHHKLVLTDGYLLNCALTYNWENLIEFCEILLDVLNTKFGYSNRRRHQKYVTAAKEQLTRQDQWGNTALHAACYNNPPLRVVTSLLQCASAAELNTLHLSPSRDLSTPLNIACATGASLDILRVLLTPPPGLEPGGAAVTMPDARGCTPLSELVIHYELQRKSPYYARSAPSLEKATLIPNYKNDPFLESFWIKVDLIIRAAWSTDKDAIATSAAGHRRQRRKWISILHGAADISESCPAVLTSLICRSYPAMIGYSDPRTGLLPLHLAVLPSSDDNSCSYQPQLAKQKASWIHELTCIYPQAVHQPFPNGRSVFCQATASGLSWNLKTNAAMMNDHDMHNETANNGPLACLWRQDPDALATPDIVTGLVPFLLAATVPMQDDNSADEDSLRLDTIFEMLRLHPQVLGDVVVV